jgi:hypothetical protein
MAIVFLFSVLQSRQVELQFSIADALVCAALGRKSPMARNVWTQSEADFEVFINFSVFSF